jgi:glucan phosphorylase
MHPKPETRVPAITTPASVSELLDQYGCGSIPFVGTENAFYERHLVFDRVIAPQVATARERFEAFSRSIRDILAQRWVLTKRTYDDENAKRIYYLSMEYLIGRSLANNLTNLLLDPVVQHAVQEKDIDWLELVEQEPDAGQGNGGLGRLAACFLDSMATMQFPATGYSLRYEYGMFAQSIVNGWQQENPDNWLRAGDPWDVARPHEQVKVKLGCSFQLRAGRLQVVPGQPSSLIGVPYDRPVVGYGGKTINTLSEYKRQLLNALRIVITYNRLRRNPNMEMVPRTFFFAGKAAPAYELAKLIIKFINNLAGTIDGDPAVRGRIKVVFLPEYNVSLAERLIPASDVSNQISTAGYEASGTSNMKFMMNGALTVGTRDGATIEMAEEAGEENFFLFGLTVGQIESSREWYSPRWHYENEPEIRAALDLIFSDHFSRNEPRVFAPLRDTLLTHGDHYMHLADLTSYCQAHERLGALYANSSSWAHKAILNVASSGRFSSDRTIAEYAADIWNVKPCPVP